MSLGSEVEQECSAVTSGGFDFLSMYVNISISNLNHLHTDILASAILSPVISASIIITTVVVAVIAGILKQRKGKNMNNKNEGLYESVQLNTTGNSAAMRLLPDHRQPLGEFYEDLPVENEEDEEGEVLNSFYTSVEEEEAFVHVSTSESRETEGGSSLYV